MNSTKFSVAEIERTPRANEILAEFREKFRFLPNIASNWMKYLHIRNAENQITKNSRQ